MTDPALLPPDPSVPGRYWISASFDEIWTWHPDVQRWHAPGWTPNRVSPELAASLGCTFAKPPARPIPGPAALEAVYALAKPPDGPSQPASPFAIGYTAGMKYLAGKLRAALETKETT